MTELPSGRRRAGDRGRIGLADRDRRRSPERAHAGPDRARRHRAGALQIARPLADDDATLSRLRLILAIVAVCAVLLSVLLGGWIAEKALAPVRRLTRTAEEVARTRDLSIRLDEDGHDEVSRLGAAFNEMLVALDRSLTAQRQLVADASHEFRTPLTSIRANAELLERGKVRDDEQNAVARAVVDQVDELDGLVTDLIELALDGEAATKFEDVRLDEIVSIEVDRLRRHLTGASFDVKSEPFTVQGDAERLSRAVANVLGERGEVEPGGSKRRGVRRPGERRRPRSRTRHRRGRPAARLRALLPLAGRARHGGLGPRARDRPPRRRSARRQRRGEQRARRRRGFHAALSRVSAGVVLPLKDNVPTRSFPIVTVGLIAANVIVYVWEVSGQGLNEHVTSWGYYPCAVDGPCLGPALHHQEVVATVFSAMFMHGGIVHIGGNLLFLWIFGNNVEDALGRVRFLCFYLLAGVAATATQSFVTLYFGTASDASVPERRCERCDRGRARRVLRAAPAGERPDADLPRLLLHLPPGSGDRVPRRLDRAAGARRDDLADDA